MIWLKIFENNDAICDSLATITVERLSLSVSASVVSTPCPHLGQLDGQFGIHLRERFVDEPHVRTVMQIERATHGAFRYAKFLGELELGPARARIVSMTVSFAVTNDVSTIQSGPECPAPSRGSGLPDFM